MIYLCYFYIVQHENSAWHNKLHAPIPAANPFASLDQGRDTNSRSQAAGSHTRGAHQVTAGMHRSSSPVSPPPDNIHSIEEYDSTDEKLSENDFESTSIQQQNQTQLLHKTVDLLSAHKLAIA